MEIKISALLAETSVCLNLKARNKEETIKSMIGMLDDAGMVTDSEQLFRALWEREELETTGIGDGVALPHCRTDAVKHMLVAFARSTEGIEFKSLDGKPVYLLFLVAAPRNESTQVLKLLACIARLVNHADFRSALLSAQTKEEVLELIRKREA